MTSLFPPASLKTATKKELLGNMIESKTNEKKMTLMGNYHMCIQCLNIGEKGSAHCTTIRVSQNSLQLVFGLIYISA